MRHSWQTLVVKLLLQLKIQRIFAPIHLSCLSLILWHALPVNVTHLCSKKEHYTAVSVWLELNLLELLLPFLTVVTSFVEGPQLSSTALIMLPTLCPVLLPPDVLFPKLACLCNTL